MRRLPLLAAACLIGRAALAEPPPTGPLPRDVRPTRYTLSLDVDPEQPRFSGEVAIAVHLDRARDTIWLHAKHLDVTQSTVAEGGAAPLPARLERATDDLVALRLPRPIGPGAATLRFAWSAPFDPQTDGVYRVATGGARYAFTQFEPIFARRAFPAFDDPGEKAPFDVTLIVPDSDRAIANTPELETTRLPNRKKRVHFSTTEPLPTYLVAFAIGPLDVVEAPPIPSNKVRARPLPLRAVAVRGRGPDLAYALRETPALVRALEDYFGLPFPFPKLDLIAVPDFASGAMENAGAITFREQLLLFGGDQGSIDQKRRFASVTAHELAHQWFGDLVTLRWWDDVWLNEAFATWMSYRAVDDVHPEYRLALQRQQGAFFAMREDSVRAARRIRQPIESDHDIENAFDAITYVKGAAVLAMFERWLGATTFQAGIRRYLEAHRGGNATTEDLLAALDAASGRDVATPFRTFLEQPGVPLVEARLDCAPNNKEGALALRQSRWLPAGSTLSRDEQWQIPVCARDPAGERCTLLASPTGRLPLGCPKWALPNAAGAGYYLFTLPNPDLARLREGYSSLSPAERLSFAQSILAGFDAGTVDAAAALPSLSPLAAEPDRALAAAPMPLLRALRDDVVPAPFRDKVERFAASLYEPAYRRLGFRRFDEKDPRATEQQLLQSAVVPFMALVARDSQARREAAAHARRYLGDDDRLHPDAVPPNLADASLAVAVEDGDPALFDKVLARLWASQDAVIRERLLRALGAALDPTLAERARALALDPRLRNNERLYVLETQLAEPRTREPALKWLETNWDKLIPLLPVVSAGRLPQIFRPLCDDSQARQLAAFATPRVQSLFGAPRNLDSALEQIHLCAARAALQRDSAARFFQSLK